MKKTYLLIFISTLIACGDNREEKTGGYLKNTGTDEQNSAVINENLTSDEKKERVNTINEEDSRGIIISCFNKNITEWYGFDEAVEEPRCKIIKNFKLSSYKCDVSRNAFGADKDAFLLENKDHRLFIYSNFKDCNTILEIRNSNGP